MPEIELIGECSDGFQGLKNIQDLQPDLIFLDIQMPKLTGFEMLELLDTMPEVVFTTAYDEFAIKAFEINVVDYLMKPFARQRLRQAVDKVLERFKTKQSNQAGVEKLIHQMTNIGKTLERIVVKSGSKIHVLPIDDIQQIEAQDDYVMLHTPTGRFMKKETMQRLEAQLPQDRFIRVHRSFIVNINQVQRIEQFGKESFLLILKNGSEVSVSKSRIKDLRREFDF